MFDCLVVDLFMYYSYVIEKERKKRAKLCLCCLLCVPKVSHYHTYQIFYFPSLTIEETGVSACLTLSQTCPGFYMSVVRSLENTVGKGEIARNYQFLLFP